MNHAKLKGIIEPVEGDPEVELLFIILGPTFFIAFLFILSLIF